MTFKSPSSTISGSRTVSTILSARFCAFSSGSLGLDAFGDVGEGQHHAIDHVVQRAVGLDARQIARAADGAHLALTRHQSVEHGLRIGQQVIAFDIRFDIGQRPAHIRGDQAVNLRRLAGEAPDDQLFIEKDRADVDVVEQVLHVVLHAGQLLDLGLQFGIDRDQFFIDGLQFLLGGFQFFIGGLQFFVGGLQFLVGGFEFLVGSLLLLDGGMQVFFGVGQIAFQFFDAPGSIGPAARLPRAGLTRQPMRLLWMRL